MKFASKLVFALTAAAAVAGFSASASADPAQGRDDRHQPMVMDHHQMGDRHMGDRQMHERHVYHHRHYAPPVRHHHHRHY